MFEQHGGLCRGVPLNWTSLLVCVPYSGIGYSQESECHYAKDYALYRDNIDCAWYLINLPWWIISLHMNHAHHNMICRDTLVKMQHELLGRCHTSLGNLTGCTGRSKCKSRLKDICHKLLPAICDLFIHSRDCCNSCEHGFMREYMSSGFPEGLPRGSANMWCNPSCPCGRKGGARITWASDRDTYCEVYMSGTMSQRMRCWRDFPPLDGDMAMYNTWNAFYIKRMPKICSSNIRGVVVVGAGGFAKFTFTAARSVIVSQSYNDKNESTIRLVTYLKMTAFPRKMSTWRERGLNVVPDHSLLSGFPTSPCKSNTCK